EGNLFPGEPAYGRIKRRKVVAMHPAVGFPPAPLAARQHGLLMVVLDQAEAMLTHIPGLLGLPLGPAQPLELEDLMLRAVRTRHVILALGGGLIEAFDTARARAYRR